MMLNAPNGYAARNEMPKVKNNQQRRSLQFSLTNSIHDAATSSVNSDGTTIPSYPSPIAPS
jgi:hypothetical protein